MEVRFYGVRGSVAVSGGWAARVGGNTACVEVTSGAERLVFDAGTGVRALGEALPRVGGPQRATFFFSHLHWDHVQGFPFFTPAYVPGNAFTLHGPGPDGATALRDALSRQMSPPGFPVPLSAMRASLRFESALPGRPVDVGHVRVTPFVLDHPQGCLGYRVEADGHSFVYATDVELSLASLGADVARHLADVDVLCLDAQYTPDEYAGRTGGVAKRGWGHSTMVDAAQVAAAVGARRLLLFHHDPARTDDQVDAMAEEARGHFAAAEPAREGQRLVLARSAA